MTYTFPSTITPAGLRYQIAKLQYYETSRYAPHAVQIEFEDGTHAQGCTFLWVGDEGQLKEGGFDLGVWQEGVYGAEVV